MSKISLATTASAVILIGFLGHKYLNQSSLKKHLTKAEAFVSKVKLKSVSSQNDNLQIELKVTDQKFCWVGDFDIIEYDLDFKNQEDIVISIESLTRPGKSQQEKVNLSNLGEKRSKTINFDLSSFDLIDTLALYICSESNKRCSEYKVVDPVNIYKGYIDEIKILERDPNPEYDIKVVPKYNRNKRSLEKTAARPHVYFSSVLFRHGSRFSFIPEKSPFHKKRASLLSTLHSFETEILKKERISKDAFLKHARTMKSLDNLPLTANKSKVAVNLPKRVKRCIISPIEWKKRNSKGKK